MTHERQARRVVIRRRPTATQDLFRARVTEQREFTDTLGFTERPRDHEGMCSRRMLRAGLRPEPPAMGYGCSVGAVGYRGRVALGHAAGVYSRFRHWRQAVQNEANFRCHWVIHE